MHHTLRFASAISVVLCFAQPASAHPDDVDTRYGRTALPGTILTECNDCHVDPVSGGDCNASDAADPWSPCLNAFGIEYRLNGWSAALGDGDTDGDGIDNRAELDGSLGGSAGFPAGAEAGCDMLLCAMNAGASVACAGNVRCTATRHIGPATNGSPAPENTNAYHYSFAFSCAPGTTNPPVNSDGDWSDRCLDVSECAGDPCGTGTCSERPLPSWTAPGYDCDCGPGYVDDGMTCVLVNACQAGADDCVAASTCIDVPGNSAAFSCVCAGGYSGNGRASGSGCNNIDECASDPCGLNDNGGGPSGNGCTERAIGTWTSPGYDCACAPGYGSNGTTCVLADECTTGLDSCVDLASCTDPTSAIGDSICTCPAGFVGNGRRPGSGCSDVNECAMGADNCDGNATCANTPGSFTCTCNAPEWSGDGTTCADYDECTDLVFSTTCDDNATCNNLSPGFECACDDGFTGDGTSCADIDECVLGTAGCDENAACTNNAGSFSCDCNEGYSGDGTTCADVDECALGTDGCGAGEVCVNNIGAPNECDCAPGLARENPASMCEARCGDAMRASGEECDDGDNDGGDGCDADCSIESGWACSGTLGEESVCENTCGDGVVQSEGVEECDDGADNSDAEADACRTNCRLATCGDGTTDSGEGCDDGDGNDDATPDSCRTDCRVAFCGDGVVDSGETCDPGGGESDATACTTLCNPDAGVMDAGGADAGADAGNDAGADSGGPDSETGTLSGGACRAVAGGDDPLPLAMFVLLGALAFIRRRR